MCAEKSLHWTTGALGDGLNPYTQAELFAWLRRTFGSGVLRGYGGNLVVSGAASPVSVAAGAASVDGIPYESDVVVTVPIPTPAASTRIDRIVVRADWTAQTCRITRIAGTEGAGAPALTQTRGTTWDIPLAQVSITTGGVITVTNEPDVTRYAVPNLQVTGANFGAGGIPASALADGACLTEILDDDGHSSGLDADKLDGQEGAYYATAAGLAGIADFINTLAESQSVQTATDWTVPEGIWTDVSGLSVTINPSTTCDVKVYGIVQLSSTSTDIITEARGRVDSSSMEAWPLGHSSGSNWLLPFIGYYGNVGAGSHTVRAQMKTDKSGVHALMRRLDVVVIPKP